MKYPIALVASSVVACVLLGHPTLARADGTPDTVVLKSSAKLRGTVLEADPARGVAVRLLDGTTRKIAAKALDHVEYAADAPPPAPPVAAAAPVAAPPAIAAALADAEDEEPAPPPPPPRRMVRRSPGLMIAGWILAPLGAVALGAGIPYYIKSKQSQTVNYGTCNSIDDCGTGSETFNDSTGVTIATGLMVGGGIAVVTGLIFVAVGGQSQPGAPDTLARTSDLGPFTLVAGPRGLEVAF